MSRDQGLKKEMQFFPLVMVFGLPTVTTRNPKAFLLSYGHMCKNILTITNDVVELWWDGISFPNTYPPGGGGCNNNPVPMDLLPDSPYFNIYKLIRGL